MKPRTESLRGDEGVGRDALEGLADVFVEVGEGFGGPVGFEAGFGEDVGLEAVVGEGEHAAVGVVDQDDLFGTQEALTDGQAAAFVGGDHAAGVADDVGVAFVQAEKAVGVEAGVHAGHHGDVLAGR
jgi:hypothetical protein